MCYMCVLYCLSLSLNIIKNKYIYIFIKSYKNSLTEYFEIKKGKENVFNKIDL